MQTKIKFWYLNNSTLLTILMKSIPKSVIVIFIIAVVAMNMLSRITLLSLPWIALNAGILVSWVTFLLLDVVVKHYGAKAANILSITAITVNLICT